MRAKLKLLLVMAVLMPAPIHAATHSDEWCADAVDFTLRTVERLEDGKSRDWITASISENYVVFQQQFPQLSESDMQALVSQVYRQKQSRFAAARATAQTCAEERTPAAMPPALPTLKGSESWCADAMDFAMGAAQNREFGYSLEMISTSVDRNPDYFRRLFEQLTPADLKQISSTAFAQQWTRFGAAEIMARSCISS